LDILGDPGVLIVDNRFVELVSGVEEGVRPVVLPEAADSGSVADAAMLVVVVTSLWWCEGSCEETEIYLYATLIAETRREIEHDFC
jgi:hypothetical protein